MTQGARQKEYIDDLERRVHDLERTWSVTGPLRTRHGLCYSKTHMANEAPGDHYLYLAPSASTNRADEDIRPLPLP